MVSPQFIWDKTKEYLKNEMTSASFDNYIRETRAVSIENNTLILEAQSEVIANTLKMFYTTPIAQAVNACNGTSLAIEITSPRVMSEAAAGKESFKPEGGGSFNLNSKYTFETFVIGKSNDFAYAAAKAVADNPAKAYNPLFIYGGVGLGKTHLMHAIGQRIIEKRPLAKISYITSETFTNELIQSIQSNRNAQFRDKYRNVDVLMVDDIQFIAGKESTQEEFFHTFNALRDYDRQIIITSDKPPKDIPTLEERLRTRFEWGLIANIQPPDLETRIAILRNKAKMEALDVDSNVLSFIAEKVNSNIRELEGSLNRVIAYSVLTKQEISLKLAETALKDILPDGGKLKITPELIQQIVADYFSIDVKDLIGKRKDKKVVFPRHISMYLIRTMTDLSLSDIGGCFGGRDHTTVINAYDKISSELQLKPDLAVKLEDIMKRIEK